MTDLWESAAAQQKDCINKLMLPPLSCHRYNYRRAHFVGGLDGEDEQKEKRKKEEDKKNKMQNNNTRWRECGERTYKHRNRLEEEYCYKDFNSFATS